ncbi:hypothetical protein [Nostoc flagelliforme]|nr:hypothetical protein [Nostoc flagelliforme]
MMLLIGVGQQTALEQVTYGVHTSAVACGRSHLSCFSLFQRS